MPDRVVPGGAVLTGGGSLLNGLYAGVQRYWHLSSRIGLPQCVIGKSDFVGHPKLRDGVGFWAFLRRRRPMGRPFRDHRRARSRARNNHTTHAGIG